MIFTDTLEYKKENFVRVIHIFDKWCPFGGVTIAYKPVLHDSNGDPRGDFANVSVAYCNRNERYNRKLGQNIAIQELANGRYIRLPIYRSGHPVHELIRIFADYSPF